MVEQFHVADVPLTERRKVKVKLATVAIFLLAGAVVNVRPCP